MRFAICDDDNLICEKMNKYLVKYFKEKHVECPDIDIFNSGEELMLSEHSYEIVFADVEMSGISGIHAARIVRNRNPRTLLIVITNYEQYLDEAFHYDAFRYIMKPINVKRLYYAIDDAINIQTKRYAKVMVETDYGIQVLYSSDIIMIEKNNTNVRVHTKSGVINSNTSFSEFEDRLLKLSFYKTHKSFLVNMQYVISFDNTTVEMDYNKIAYLTRRSYKKFKDAFALYVNSVT